MVKKRGLGRGLDALLAGINTETEDEVSSKEHTEVAKSAYELMSVHKIQRGRYQPRRDLEPEALEDLASSIRVQGVIQPIIIRSVEDGRYEIIAGERRWRASQIAGLDEIPVIVKNVPDEAAIAMALIENIQREDLNPMEEAIALQRLQDEFELTQQEVADAVGKSRSTVTNLLRLMKLTGDVRKMLEYGDIEMGHARALLGLDLEQQLLAAQEVVGKALSVRQTEELVRKWQAGDAIKTVRDVKKRDPQLEQISSDLSRRFAAKVSINQSNKGKGKITIAYDSPDALENILKNFAE
ncbi:ParB/RepB/Spo0J family partition protein [Neptunomonas japonica]|uniref:Probable chromosome-partitioning protein ParB n=1 Tax=Neptunomonas japonica JAMM 1380 TaxID=1441457 RepID=A0A7R6SXL7_9GAMM|nr:ParB/RepB/Spo0J family partition protein [Neptunomonas japonica]BBB31636.1 chromosome partitioning protein, ParB family [Neptunomonas japonica JAMM 1380]